MTLTNIGGHGASVKLEVEDTAPAEQKAEFDGRMIFEKRGEMLRVTTIRKRKPDGREYPVVGEIEMDVVIHALSILNGEGT